MCMRKNIRPDRKPVVNDAINQASKGPGFAVLVPINSRIMKTFANWLLTEDDDDETKPAFGQSKHSFSKVKMIADTLRKNNEQPKTVYIPSKDFRGFKATQSEISPWSSDKNDGEKDHTPLYPELIKHPVVVEDYDGNLHVLDGHNRINHAIRSGASGIRVHKFHGYRVPKLWK